MVEFTTFKQFVNPGAPSELKVHSTGIHVLYSCAVFMSVVGVVICMLLSYDAAMFCCGALSCHIQRVATHCNVLTCYYPL